ncbi:hypothetical protein HDA40_002150 [Hamadaea flava]|uniref:Uncharacterized protein n=1 Tax=Hamadaea flava TaxID=1742688 RepID=A0ABV8LJQ2_9ACTN|nr:hypothetical protein [Hamadaea flava]MCP2323643.1 hypothetical protein [Hamadaea flava]
MQPSPFTILDPLGFADAVPQLAHHPLETIHGCLDAVVDELTLTPLLVHNDTAYLVTPAFVLTVADPVATNEHGTALFRQVRTAQIEAMLAQKFVTCRAPLTWLTDDQPAVAHHAVIRAVDAARNVPIALLFDAETDLRILLPGLSDLVTSVGDCLAELGPYCGDHLGHAEQNADSIRDLMRVAAQQLVDLRDLCAAHPISARGLPTLTGITVTGAEPGFVAVGDFHTSDPTGGSEGLLTTSGHASITDAVDAMIATATRCNLMCDNAELSAPDLRTEAQELELAGVAANHRLRRKP